MTTAALGNNAYLGPHADDAAVLAFVQGEKLDTNGDGTGAVPDGAWYWNTTLMQPRISCQASMDPFATGAGGFSTTPETVPDGDTVTIADGQQLLVTNLCVDGNLVVDGTLSVE